MEARGNPGRGRHAPQRRLWAKGGLCGNLPPNVNWGSTFPKTPFPIRDVRYAELQVMREYLESLARLLRQEGDNARAILVEDAISGTDAELDAFLASNELWGGSGSIADCGGAVERNTARRNIE